MPDDEPNGNDPNSQTDSNESPPSTEAPDGASETSANEPARGLRGAGLRYTAEDGVPEWAVGKTADEIVEIANELHQSLLDGSAYAGPSQQGAQPNGAQSPANGSRQPQPPQMNAQNGGAPPQPDPQLIYNDPSEYQRQLDAYNRWQTQQTIQQASGPLLQAQANMARDACRRDPEYADVWDAYAPEIDALMQRVPMQNRADPKSWQQAAEMVAGRHRKELARKEAERLAAEGNLGATISGDATTPGADSGPSRDAISQLFADDHPAIQKFKEQGISAQKVRSHGVQMGHSPDEYAKILTGAYRVTA